LGYLKPQIMYRLVDHTPTGQITTAAPGREARQARYEQTDHFIHVADRFLQRDQVPLFLGNAEPDQFGLRPLKISVRLTAWRLPPLAPQEPQVGNAALIEREAVTLPLDHAFGFELADVGPAAIEVQRRADALTVAGFLDRGRETGLATDGRSTVTASLIVFVPLRRGTILRLQRQREGGLYRSPNAVRPTSAFGGIAYMAGFAAGSTRSRANGAVLGARCFHPPVR
jgi:hypothetical protein